MHEQLQQLPTGKTIIRAFDDRDQLTCEMHCYGEMALDIAITMEFGDGVKWGETYIIKQQIVTRPKYEEARLQYPDMPPADTLVKDIWAAANFVDADRHAGDSRCD